MGFGLFALVVTWQFAIVWVGLLALGLVPWVLCVSFMAGCLYFGRLLV